MARSPTENHGAAQRNLFFFKAKNIVPFLPSFVQPREKVFLLSILPVRSISNLNETKTHGTERHEGSQSRTEKIFL